MRQRTLDAVESVNTECALEEINDTARLSAYNPLSLPLLLINGVPVASQNPPRTEEIAKWLQQKAP